MKNCVHVVRVLTATKNDDQVHFLAMTPVLDSVLSSYINTDANSRATMLGYGQVQKMIKGDKAVEGTVDGDDIVVGNLFRPENSNLSDQKVRSIVSQNCGGANLSSLKIREGVPGKKGAADCVSIGGTICLSYNVRRGYTTFYVRGQDTNIGQDYHRKYVVVDWSENNTTDSQLVVLDAETGEFSHLVEELSSFGRHVEDAYKVSMDEDMDITIQSSKIANLTVYEAENEAEDVENLTKDPSKVAEKDLALVMGESEDVGSLVREALSETIEGEGMAALAGARDKGFLKDGGTVMMPQHEEEVAVLELESLFH